MKRSTKFAIVGCVLTFGGLIALAPFAVENYYRRQLRATLARYAAAGDPIDLKRYQTASIPDDQNRGAQLLRLAQPILNIPTQINELQGRLWETEPPEGSPPLTAAEKKSVADFLRDNLPPDAELDAALQLPQTDWQDPSGMTHLSPLRKLTVALADDARFAALTGDAPRFSRRVQQILGIADAAATDAQMLGLFVQVGLETLASLIVIENPVSLTDEQTRTLSAALLEETNRNSRSCKALEHERAWVVEMLLSPNPAGTPAGLPLRIYYLYDGPASVDIMSLIRDAVAAETNTKADEILNRASTIISTTRMPPPSGSVRTMELIRKNRTDRRLAAVALATRAYIAKHSRPPASLSDLVPEFLPAIPTDPFDPADGPLLSTAGLQVIYSRGTNRTDEQGDITPRARGSSAPNPWQAPDRGISFAASTSTQPSR